MKNKKHKALRIAGITAGSILAIIILIVAILAAIIFSPKRLTPVAQKALDKYFPGKAELTSVGLTYFKTRPYLGIDIRGVTIYDGMEGSPYEKLLDVGSLAASFDLKSFLKYNQFIIKGVYLDNTHANLYTSPEGATNIDFLMGESTPDDTVEEDSTMLIYAELHTVSLKDFNAEYRNDSTGMLAAISNAGLNMRGTLHQDSIDASIKAQISNIRASITDSTSLAAAISDISMQADAIKFGPTGSILAKLSTGEISAESGDMHASTDGISVTGSDISFELDGYTPTTVNGNISALVKNIEANDNNGTSAHTGNINLDLNHFSMKDGLLEVTDAILKTAEIGFSSESESTLTSASVDSIRLVANAKCDTAMTDIASDITLHLGEIQFITKDDTSNISLQVKRPALIAKALMDKERINISAGIETDGLMTVMNDEVMTDNWPLAVSIPSVDTDTAFTFVSVSDNSFIEVNGEKIIFGANANKTANKIAGNAQVRIDGLDIEKVIGMIPESYRSSLDGIQVKGMTDVGAKLKGSWSDNGAALQKLTANLNATDFYTSLNDSIEVAADKLEVKLESPDGHEATANIKGNNLDVMMITESVIRANLKDISLKANVKDIADSLMAMTASAQLDVKNISASMDTVSASLKNASLSANMYSQSEKPTFAASIGFDQMDAALGETLSALIGKTSMNASAQFDSTQTEIFGRWDPQFNFKVDRSQVEMLEDPITLEGLDVNFTQGSFNIREGRVSLGNSNIELWGDIYNIGPFMRDEGLLTGELFLESDFVDVTQLMEYTSGLGSTEEEEEEKQDEIAELPTDSLINDTLESVPFVVPRGIDLALYTNFSEIEFNHHTFNNVGGDVTVKDGKVIMQEVGFSSNTAEMQLTAIYNAPEEDNRFVELDFHLLDIQIDELIDLIPSVDSIVPMLKAFKGEAQFHLAAETKLQRNNMPKMSTLMGAASIEGKDLVIMDNDVFKGIKRKLLMSRKAQNKIDDLNIEMQVLREKVDLYPFLIHMDKYQAVIGGRHNINKGLDCRYHISLTDSPLPFRLGVTVSGPINDISEKPLKHIKFARCEYDRMFKPTRRNDVEERILAIRRDIAETLKSNVK